jgi:hypothetical protein
MPHQGNLLEFLEKDCLFIQRVISMGDADLRLLSWTFGVLPLGSDVSLNC